MRRIPPVRHAHSLITKPRVIAVVAVFVLFITAVSLPSLATQPNAQRQYIANADLGLYSISDTYTKSDTTYDLTYPFLGQEGFDSAVAQAVKHDKEAFQTALAETPPYVPSQLGISYTTFFYNQDYLSLSLTTKQAIGDQKNTRETTFLYNRKEQKMISLGELFNSEGYADVLAKSTHSTLKKKMKKAYNKEQITEHTKPNPESFPGFIINKKQQLELVFQPGTVAPEDKGVIKVPVDGASIRGLTNEKIATNLVKIPPKPKPKPEPPEPAIPAANLNPAPVPQADPSGIDCAVAACVALTFDDGPKSETNTMLDILDANNAKATFFVLGLQAERYPSIVQRIQNTGHVVGNHTYDHQNLQQMSVADAAGQMSRTADIIQGITGVRPGIARAPYGAIDQGLAVALQTPFIGWSVDPQDWMVRDAAHVCNAVVNQAHAGAIILAHDIHPTSVDGFRCAIPQLIQKGFVLVTVPQLLGFGPGTPPGIYSSR